MTWSQETLGSCCSKCPRAEVGPSGAWEAAGQNVFEVHLGCAVDWMWGEENDIRRDTRFPTGERRHHFPVSGSEGGSTFVGGDPCSVSGR